MAWLAYLVLLFAWLLFVAPAAWPPHGARGWARGAAALGFAAALYEGWMSFVWGPTVVGPIRIDIFLIFLLLASVDLVASARLHRAGWRRTGLVAGVVSLLASGVMAASWMQTQGELTRLDGLRSEGDAQLFEAKFANAAAYEAYFGVAAKPASEGLPVGHWQNAESLPYTRLVVGGDGRAHLFYRCGESECPFGPGGVLAPHGDGFAGTLVHRGVGVRELELDEPEGDALLLRIDGKPHRLRRAPPPLLGVTHEERLTYLGAFSAVEPVRQHARVSQLWLWREDDALHAVGIFRILLPGRRAEFVTPEVLGRGEREGEAWRFSWRNDDGPPREARVRLLPGAEGVELTLPGRGGSWPPQRLAPGAIFRDEVMELASLRSGQAWQRWFETVLVGHSSAAEIPPR